MKHTENVTCKNGVVLRHTYSDTYYLLDANDEEFSDAYDPLDSAKEYRENTAHRLDDDTADEYSDFGSQ